MSGSRVKLKSKRPESLREGLGSSSGDMQRLKNPIPFGLQSYLLSFGGTGVGASRLQIPSQKGVTGSLGHLLFWNSEVTAAARPVSGPPPTTHAGALGPGGGAEGDDARSVPPPPKTWERVSPDQTTLQGARTSGARRTRPEVRGPERHLVRSEHELNMDWRDRTESFKERPRISRRLAEGTKVLQVAGVRIPNGSRCCASKPRRKTR